MDLETDEDSHLAFPHPELLGALAEPQLTWEQEEATVAP